MHIQVEAAVKVNFGFPQWLSSKESACSTGDAGDLGLIPGLESFSGGGQGNPLQYSCLENLTDREAWRATVHSAAESDMTEATEHARMKVNFMGQYTGCPDG